VTTKLPASRRPRRGLQAAIRLVTEPHRQAPGLAQARVIRRPGRHFALLLRDEMATRGVILERHGGTTDQEKDMPPIPTDPTPPTADPCNNADHGFVIRLSTDILCGRHLWLAPACK
jgi:hypothetical protein